jgi:vitamin B12 transporter
MKYRIRIATAIVASTVAASATTNEIIVSATRIETPIRQMAASVNVATHQDIEDTKIRVLPELLQMIPGVAVSRSGGPGQQTSVYIRGAKPQHALVMIDGVRMNGQLDLAGYDMANLQLLDIERIEVLKGPQSPLYGSDAMAGVINIVTKKGEGKPAPYFDIEGGSHGTWRAATGVSGGDALLNYNASVSHYDRQGESALANNTEKDGTRNTTVATRLGTTPTDDSEINLTIRYIDSTSDYDDGFGTAHSLFKYDSEQLVTRAEGKILLLDEMLETRLGASYLMLDRYEYGFSSTYEADTLSADWVNTVYLHDNHTLLLGFDGYHDDFMFDEGFGATDGNLYNAGIFGTYQAWLLKPWVVNLGARHDDHSEFAGKTTYQASSAYTVDATATRVKGSYGTGFKAPSSYQLFASFGNPDLQPEESEGWELGLEQQILTNRLSVGATWFHTRYDNLIDYDFGTFTFENISEAETDGVEVYSTATLLDNLRLRVGYTYLDNDDQSGGSFTLRRPQHQVDADLNYAVTKAFNLNLYAGYVGSREDVGGTLDAYTLVNLAARYQITKNVQVYGRIDNLLDENYQTVLGYNADQISAYAGVKITL